MLTFIISCLLSSNSYAGGPVVFGSDSVKTLKPGINLKGNSKILSGTVDPSSVATDSPKGSLYLNTSNGNVYKKNDSGSTTNWSTLGGASAPSIVTKTSNYTIQTTDDIIWGDATGGTVTLTLPAASAKSKFYYVKKIDGVAANRIDIATAGTDSFDGSQFWTQSLITKNDAVFFYSDGVSAWKIAAVYIQSTGPVVRRTEFVNFGGPFPNTGCTVDPCTISNQSGGISAVNRTGAGRYVVHFTTSFTVVPACIFSITSDSNSNPAVQNPAVNQTGAINNNGTTPFDCAGTVVCIGS